MNSSFQKLSLSSIPPNAVPAEVTVVPEVSKVEFGYRGFDSTSITSVIPKHEIIRPRKPHYTIESKKNPRKNDETTYYTTEPQ